jgi:putative oxidoreductase
VHGTTSEVPLERFLRSQAQALHPLEDKPSFLQVKKPRFIPAQLARKLQARGLGTVAGPRGFSLPNDTGLQSGTPATPRPRPPATKYPQQTSPPMNQQSHQHSLLNRIARVLLCLVFIHAVIGKLTGFAGVAGAIAAKGLPLAPVLLVAAMALMAVGSALVISGWKARLGAVLLLLFLVPTTLLFHGDVADKMERIQLFKNLAIMGGLLLVADQDSKR